MVMIKWEYAQVNCVFDYVMAMDRAFTGILRATGRDGIIIIEGKYFLEVFNQLGELGWEMCGSQRDEGTDIIYFKRPVE